MKHVGIYIGDQKFVHASTSSGVIVSEMTNSYWSKDIMPAGALLMAHKFL